ncbi:MAG: hypothetical protein U9O98_03570 [Asgard group archaeon]|nr:hypothetical protein [Asgard group archaeon]
MPNWDTSLKRYSSGKNDSDYIEICSCHNPKRFLRYDVNTKEYYGVKGCNIKFACAKLQINKHKLIISYRRKKLLEVNPLQGKQQPKIHKNPLDQTIDQFFP